MIDLPLDSSPGPRVMQKTVEDGKGECVNMRLFSSLIMAKRQSGHYTLVDPVSGKSIAKMPNDTGAVQTFLGCLLLQGSLAIDVLSKTGRGLTDAVAAATRKGR